MPFATKYNKRIKVQGSLETLRHLIKIRQDTLLAPPTLGRSIVLNDSKEKKRRDKRKEEGGRERNKESSKFIEVRKGDLGGEGAASCSEAFGCFLRSCDFPFGHHSLARRSQYLVFVARCLFGGLRFGSMSTVHHHSAHRLHAHGAPHRCASLHLPPHQDYALLAPVGQHQHTTNFLPPQC